MRSLVLLPLAALLSLGCSASSAGSAPDRRESPLPGTPGITFETQRPAYRRGDTATLILRNGTDDSLGYNLCGSSREIRTGGSWRRIPLQRICTLELRILAPGAETHYREPITAEWQPGEYRISASVERMRSGNRGQIHTPPFTVER